MKGNFDMLWKKQRKIELKVDGRPPKKGKSSCWSNEGERVLKLREKALASRTKEGLSYFEGPVKVELIVYDPNIITRKDSHDYHGDLDALVAGVLDSLQPAPDNKGFEIDPILKNRPDLDPTKPLIIKDDSQVVTIVAKKLRGSPRYSLRISQEDV